MKIGILTLFHKNYNWGGVLQGYALKMLLEAEFSNAQADLLIYRGKNAVYENRLRQAMQYSLADVCRKIAQKLKRNSACRELLAQRYALFDAFMNEYTSNPRAYNDETLIEAAREYDCLISGSDQVWNPNVGYAGFFQKMVANECKKVAYAASIARDDLSGHERKTMIPLIERFDWISVREKTAKRILDQYSDGRFEVTEVLDPTMMLPREEWELLSDRSTTKFNGQYAVAFFFSESAVYRGKIAEYCKERNLRLKFIPFAQGTYISSDMEGEADRLFDLGPAEFVNLIQNAQCVFTDSFHGCVFSIIFHKKFCVFERDKKSKVSKNSRLHDLLEKFGVSDRLVKDLSALGSVTDRPIDYTQVNMLQERYRKESLEFLRKAISGSTEKQAITASHVGELETDQCCGCELCVTQCPQNCIEMRQNSEGFYFPWVDDQKCVQCGQCLRTCRQKIGMKKATRQEAYVGFHKNKEIRNQSSSGGLFYALASQVLQDGGCVYGAAYTDAFEVKHIRVDCMEALPQLMTSKYVQSQMTGILEQILEDLENHRVVLFSGTPCQAGAVDYYVRKKQKKDNLILVDFICHGVPSPGVWQSYTKCLERSYGSPLMNISFRDKSKGWHDYHLKATMERTELLETHDLNPYMQSFLSDWNIRKSCYCCAFKGDDYVSDITLGDAWKIEQDYPEWADDKGTSFFVIRTPTGQNLIDQIADSFLYRKTDYLSWTQRNPSLVDSTAEPIGRNAFFKDYLTMEPEDFWTKYGEILAKKRIRYTLKKAAKLLGVEKRLRQICK